MHPIFIATVAIFSLIAKIYDERVGAWRSMFSQKGRAVFAEECGELMIELGYEKDQAWVQTSTEKIE